MLSSATASVTRVRGVLVDVGVLGDPTVEPDVPATAVAEAAGTTLDALRAAASAGGHRSDALDAMVRGASALVARWREAGRCDGVMGLGGSGGTTIVSGVLRSLPIGVPKLLVSTMTSGDTRPYVGARDLTLVHPVTDIQGLNRVSAASSPTRRTHGRQGEGRAAPGEAAGRGRRAQSRSDVGVTTPRDRAAGPLEAAGFETIVFHPRCRRPSPGGADRGGLDRRRGGPHGNELTSSVGGILSAGPGR